MPVGVNVGDGEPVAVPVVVDVTDGLLLAVPVAVVVGEGEPVAAPVGVDVTE